MEVKLEGQELVVQELVEMVEMEVQVEMQVQIRVLVEEELPIHKMVEMVQVE